MNRADVQTARVDAILAALAAGKRFGVDISAASGVPTTAMYPLLDDLVESGAVRASWFWDPAVGRRRAWVLVKPEARW